MNLYVKATIYGLASFCTAIGSASATDGHIGLLSWLLAAGAGFATVAAKLDNTPDSATGRHEL